MPGETQAVFVSFHLLKDSERTIILLLLKLRIKHNMYIEKVINVLVEGLSTTENTTEYKKTLDFRKAKKWKIKKDN